MTSVGAIQNSLLSAGAAEEGQVDKKAKLEKAARDFEGFVMGYIFANAAQSVRDESEENHFGSDMYQSMLIQNLSEQGSKSPQGFGLAKYLVHQIELREGAVSTTAAAAENEGIKSNVISDGSGGSEKNTEGIEKNL